jgi:predicted methyltransferase
MSNRYGFERLLAVLLCVSAVSPARAVESTGTPDESIDAAIASPQRLASDLQQDRARQPAEFLAFVGVRPGMRVIDVFSASGYYTELLARIVGAKGQVIAYNNPPYAEFAEKGIVERYAGDRLSNVRQITAPIEDLVLSPNSLDAAIFVMSYHDLYWRPEDGSWPPTDALVLLEKLFVALKPGGVVVVQDHVANTGGDTTEVVGKLHRIDPGVVRQDFLHAGFEFAGYSEMLANPDDDHSLLVYDPAIRGRTDRFVYRFRKPLN